MALTYHGIDDTGAIRYVAGLPQKPDCPMAKPKNQPFDQALAELEAVVKKMDSGSLSLEDSLAAFEEGVGLIRRCQESLKNAEQRVKLLVEQGGELTATDWKNPEEQDENDDDIPF